MTQKAELDLLVKKLNPKFQVHVFNMVTNLLCIQEDEARIAKDDSNKKRIATKKDTQLL